MKLRELKSFDRDRSKFASELENRRKALADREQKLSRAEQELQTRERAGIVKPEGPERALARPEDECRARDKEVSERERKFVSREADLKKDGARVAAKDEALGEREAELLLKQERLRGELESLEREYTDKTGVVREAATRSAALDQREVELAAREAEMTRRSA